MKACRPYVAMVIVQLAYGGSNILIKISLERGLHQLVFVVYRHAIAMFMLGPFAYALERDRRPDKLTFTVMAKIFILALLGATIHLNVYYVGLAYVSPTVASALSNVVPSFTFFLAFLFGMEKVTINGSGRGGAKVLGTIICIGGSLIFTFCKGGYLFRNLEERPLIHVYNDAHHLRHHGNGEDWIKGSAIILSSNVAWCAWLILQAMVCKDYSAPLSMNALICFFASLQSGFLAVFFARNPSLWKLEANVQLLTIVYCGVINSGLIYYLQTWCISVKGPVFAAMFSPLQLIFVALFSAIAFAERLHVGSLMGAVIIIVGLYCLLWGKRKDDTVVGVDDDDSNEKTNETTDDK